MLELLLRNDNMNESEINSRDKDYLRMKEY